MLCGLPTESHAGIVCLLWVAFGLSAALLPGLHAHVHTAVFFRHESFLKFVTCATYMRGALANDPAGLGWQRRERYRPSLPRAVSGIVRVQKIKTKI